jgi:hypothetical protein
MVWQSEPQNHRLAPLPEAPRAATLGDSKEPEESAMTLDGRKRWLALLVLCPAAAEAE